MAGDCLALAIHTAGSGADPAEPPIFAAAGSGDRRCLIGPEQLGDFLRVHHAATIACHDAASLHWAIDEHLRRSRDSSARRILWEFSRACRLHDVQLLDQLLRLAHHGGDPPPLTLDRLATLLQGRAGTSEASRPSPRLPSGEPVGADEGPAVTALRDVAVVAKIYRKQLSQSDRLARRLRIPREIIERFGPWALGLQVQGAIALRRAASNGLRLRKDAAPELRRTCEEAYRDCSRLLYRHPTIRRCFRWDGEEIRRDKTGLPDADKPKLREWLRQTLDAMAGAYNTPFEPPRTDKGDISTVPDFWGDLTLIQPELRAWSQLWAAASVLKSLDGVSDDGRLRPRYGVLPRIRSMDPNLEQLRRLGRASVFEAAPGHVLLVGRLDHLVLRCHAEVCVLRGGEPNLGGWFIGGLDPVRRVAWSLYNHDRGRDGGEAPMAEGTFDEIDAQEPGRFAHWKDVGAVLLDAVHRGLTAPHVREILARDFGRDISLAEADRYCRLLEEDVFVDLAWFVKDETLEILRAKLDCDPADVEGLMLEGTPENAAAALRNLIAGRSRSPRAFARLREICRNEHFRAMMAADEGSPELFDALFGDVTVNPVGRGRKGLFFTLTRAADHLDLADDVMKTVLFEIVAAGHELVGYADGEFALQAREDAATEAMRHTIEGVAEAAARKLMGNFPPRCRVEMRQVW